MSTPTLQPMQRAAKRFMDFTLSVIGLVVTSPITFPVAFIVWLSDGHSPFYKAQRVGRGGQTFTMLKLRSMVVNADRTGVDSTGALDARITPVGRFIRRYKLDELTQLLNVVIGDMSLVGPRPNVRRETDLYTAEESRLLSVKPGITDFASIVFSDEGDILEDKPDPDIAYNQLIRPGKSRLGLFYVDHSSWRTDIRLIGLTGVSLFSRAYALEGVSGLLKSLGASDQLTELARRDRRLVPTPPPGSDRIVTTRDDLG